MSVRVLSMSMAVMFAVMTAYAQPKTLTLEQAKQIGHSSSQGNAETLLVL